MSKKQLAGWTNYCHDQRKFGQLNWIFHLCIIFRPWSNSDESQESNNKLEICDKVVWGTIPRKLQRSNQHKYDRFAMVANYCVVLFLVLSVKVNVIFLAPSPQLIDSAPSQPWLPQCLPVCFSMPESSRRPSSALLRCRCCGVDFTAPGLRGSFRQQ